ncbi:MAG: Adenylate cyclase 2, partial [Alphaproteobacteria bacterium MarineAlpha2_Bin1]
EFQTKWKNLGAEKGVEVRMGITSGYCTVGNFGSEMRLDYTVLGSPVNLASRLQAIAKPNSIYLSESTYNLVRDFFDFKEVDEITPKGFVRPIKVYQLINNLFLENRKLNDIKEYGKYIRINIDDIENIGDVITEIDQIRNQLEDIKNK